VVGWGVAPHARFEGMMIGEERQYQCSTRWPVPLSFSRFGVSLAGGNGATAWHWEARDGSMELIGTFFGDFMISVCICARNA
jgi:hypothetical protein